MFVRFKFRSSLTYDSIDIESRSSISVRDLRSKIIHQKNLNRQDFDLIFSDALTGQEYSDENFPIQSGSSIIIKRVPAGLGPFSRVPIESIENFRLNDTALVKTTVPHHVNAEATDNFDDFGVDLCPIPELISSNSFLEIDKTRGSHSENMNVPRCSDLHVLRWPKQESSDQSDEIPQCPTHIITEGNISRTDLVTKVEVHTKLEQATDINLPAETKIDFPLELKCSLCSHCYKEAVMIPCCQHSFCKKCIHFSLIQKERCPMCLSTKCKVEDLLPNLSLRQAIEHFLECQNLICDPDHAFNSYAPDGESVIQAKDASCAMTVHQRDTNLPYSFSATKRRPSKINTELVGSTLPVDVISELQDCAAVSDFQGENQPSNLPACDEGGGRNFAAKDRQRKDFRTCYMCGSPDHFIRDCPAASGPYPTLGDFKFQRDEACYSLSFWGGNSFPQIRPIQHQYGNPCNSNIVMYPPFAAPSYLPSMYGCLPVPGGFASMMGMSDPVGNNRNCLLNENLWRDEENYFNMQYEPQRSNSHMPQMEMGKGVISYKDGIDERSRKNQWHDDEFNLNELRPVRNFRSRSSRDKSNCSSLCSEHRNKSHSRGSKKTCERKHNGSDCSRGHNRIDIEKDVRRKVKDVRRHHDKHHRSYSESGSEHSTMPYRKEKDYGTNRDRWRMISGSSEDHYRQGQKKKH